MWLRFRSANSIFNLFPASTRTLRSANRFRTGYRRYSVDSFVNKVLVTFFSFFIWALFIMFSFSFLGWPFRIGFSSIAERFPIVDRSCHRPRTRVIGGSLERKAAETKIGGRIGRVVGYDLPSCGYGKEKDDFF